MPAQLDRYSDILQRIASEIIACSPRHWERGELAVQSDGARLTYRLHNEGHPDRATLSADLRKLIDQLYVRMRRDGNVWTAARLRWWIEGGAIRFDPQFEYPASPPRRGWWRFGR